MLAYGGARKIGALLTRAEAFVAGLGPRLPLRATVRERLRRLAPAAELDADWRFCVFTRSEGGLGTALIVPSADVAPRESEWRWVEADGWRAAFRRIRPDRLVITDSPALVDAHPAFVDRLVELAPRADLDLRWPLAGRLDPPPSEAHGRSAGQRWLEARARALLVQVEALDLTVELAARHIAVGAALRARAGSGLARIARGVHPVGAAAVDQVPAGAIAALLGHFPRDAWRSFDRMLRAAGGQPIDPRPIDPRRRLLEALGGEFTVVLDALAPGPHLLARIAADDPEALRAALRRGPDDAEAGAGPLRLDALLDLVADEDAQATWLALGPRAPDRLAAAVSGERDRGPGADLALAEVVARAAPDAFLLASVDALALAAALGGRRPRAPTAPLALGLSLGRRGDALLARIELPREQLGAVVFLLGRVLRDRPPSWSPSWPPI